MRPGEPPVPLGLLLAWRAFQLLWMRMMARSTASKQARVGLKDLLAELAKPGVAGWYWSRQLLDFHRIVLIASWGIEPDEAGGWDLVWPAEDDGERAIRDVLIRCVRRWWIGGSASRADMDAVRRAMAEFKPAGGFVLPPPEDGMDDKRARIRNAAQRMRDLDAAYRSRFAKLALPTVDAWRAASKSERTTMKKHLKFGLLRTADDSILFDLEGRNDAFARLSGTLHLAFFPRDHGSRESRRKSSVETEVDEARRTAVAGGMVVAARGGESGPSPSALKRTSTYKIVAAHFSAVHAKQSAVCSTLLQEVFSSPSKSESLLTASDHYAALMSELLPDSVWGGVEAIPGLNLKSVVKPDLRRIVLTVAFVASRRSGINSIPRNAHLASASTARRWVEGWKRAAIWETLKSRISEANIGRPAGLFDFESLDRLGTPERSEA